MRIRLVLLIVAIAAMNTTAPVARAEWSIGRFFGYGWGDGYHSHAACPPKRGVGYGAVRVDQQPATLPWWATPAPGTEPEALPHPAANPEPNTTHALPPAGTSLFRQPGEGSSIIISNGATGRR